MNTAHQEEISGLGDKFKIIYAECDEIISDTHIIKQEGETFLQNLNEAENSEKCRKVSDRLDVLFELMKKLKSELESFVKLINPVKPNIPHISVNTTKTSLVYLTGDNPWNFWLQESDFDVKGLYKSLIEKFENGSLQSYLSLPPVGEYVCYLERRKVFRGIVIQHLEKERLKIIDVDTSCLKVLSLNRVYQADEDVCSMNAIAIKCCLSEDFDSSFRWSPDLGSLFTNNLKNGKLHVKILKELPGYPPQFCVDVIVENEDEECVSNVNKWICDRVLPELKKLYEEGVETSCEFLSSNALDPYFQDYSNSANNFQFQEIMTELNGIVKSDNDLNTDSRESPHLHSLHENLSETLNPLEYWSPSSEPNKSYNERSSNSSLSVAEMLERSLSSSHLPTTSDKQSCDSNCSDIVVQNSEQNNDEVSEDFSSIRSKKETSKQDVSIAVQNSEQNNEEISEDVLNIKSKKEISKQDVSIAAQNSEQNNDEISEDVLNIKSKKEISKQDVSQSNGNCINAIPLPNNTSELDKDSLISQEILLDETRNAAESEEIAAKTNQSSLGDEVSSSEIISLADKLASNEFAAFKEKLIAYTLSRSENTLVSNNKKNSDLPKDNTEENFKTLLDEFKTVKPDLVSDHTQGAAIATDITSEILLDESITSNKNELIGNASSEMINFKYEKNPQKIRSKNNGAIIISNEDKSSKTTETQSKLSEGSVCKSEKQTKITSVTSEKNNSLISTNSNSVSSKFSIPNVNSPIWVPKQQPPNLIPQFYKPPALPTFPSPLIPFQQQTTQTMTGFWPLQQPQMQFYPQQHNQMLPTPQWGNFNPFQQLNMPYAPPNLKTTERIPQLPFNQWSANVIDTSYSSQQQNVTQVLNDSNVTASEKSDPTSIKETNKTDVVSLSEPTSNSTRNSDIFSDSIDKENYHVKLKPPMTLMKPNENLLLMMAHIESPGEFYVHVVTKNNLFIDKLKDEMLTYYSEAKHIVNKDYEDAMNRYGKFCACKWPDDNHWYRVEVLDWNKGDKVLVYFVDYGNRDEVPLSSIQPLVDQFTKLAMMAQPCHLANVYAADSVYNIWSDEAINFFIGLIEFDTAYNAIVVPSGRKYSSNSLSIKLFLHDTKRDLVSVNDLMVAEGYAITKRKSSFSSSTNSQIDSEAEDCMYNNTLKSSNIEEDEEWDKFNPLEEDFHSSSNAFAIDQENVNVAVTGYKGKDESDICRFFARDGRCWKSVCRKKHELPNTDHVPDKAFNDIKLPNPDEVVLVKITHFCSTNRFFAQLQNSPSDDDQEETLETLSNFMNRRSTIREMKPLDEPPLVGQLVIAKSSDGYWFRARVLGPPEDGEVEVMFVDYGTEESVFEQDIRKMTSSFLHLPFQAVECFLADIGPSADKTISQKAVDILRRNFSGTTLYAHIKSSFDSLSRLEVFLRDEENMDVGKWLIKQGLCTKQKS